MTFELEAIDRMYLNAYVPLLQTGAGFVYFLKTQRNAAAVLRGGSTRWGFEQGIQRAIERLLADPDFLFRIERDPKNVAPGTPYRLTDLELASRLSFFLRSSIPDEEDEELLDVAIRGKLSDGVVLERQRKLGAKD